MELKIKGYEDPSRAVLDAKAVLDGCNEEYFVTNILKRR